MPSRNIVKRYDANCYYHVYNRGVNKDDIFIEDHDYAVFLSLLKRHLNSAPVIGSQGRAYDWLANDVELVAFCLMPNHFHMLLYQSRHDAITKLLRAVGASYTNYFNAKYSRVGSLCQGNFKAVKVSSDSQLIWLSRYIHRNPPEYLSWKWSSLDYWIGNKTAVWLKPNKACDMDGSAYLKFLKDDDDFSAVSDELNGVSFD